MYDKFYQVCGSEVCKYRCEQKYDEVDTYTYIEEVSSKNLHKLNCSTITCVLVKAFVNGRQMDSSTVSNFC